MRKTPLEAVHELDLAFNRRDLDATLSFYEDAASMVLEPGKIIHGKRALRDAFKRAFELKGTASQLKTNVIESGDLALFTSKWVFNWISSDSVAQQRENFTTTVFRKTETEEWLIVIDNSFGPAILNQT